MIGISYLAGNHSSPIRLTDRGFLINIFIGIIRFKFALLKLEVVCYIGFHVRNSCFSNSKMNLIIKELDRKREVVIIKKQKTC